MTFKTKRKLRQDKLHLQKKKKKVNLSSRGKSEREEEWLRCYHSEESEQDGINELGESSRGSLVHAL